MSIKNIKTIFSGDIQKALTRARADEREQCEKEKEKALKEQEAKLVGEWSLKVKELEAQIESMEFRIQNHEKEKKAVENERQKIREIAIRQRQVVSDIVFLAQQKRDDDMRKLQDFQKLETSINNIEFQLIGIEKKSGGAE